jgi:hypothetical protein
MTPEQVPEVESPSLGISHHLWMAMFILKAVSLLGASVYLGMSEFRAIKAAKEKAN